MKFCQDLIFRRIFEDCYFLGTTKRVSVQTIVVETSSTQIAIAVASVVVTLLAVGVALWGPSFRRWRLRPRLSLDHEMAKHDMAIRLGVINDYRRKTAHDVELYIMEVIPPEGEQPISPGSIKNTDYRVQRCLEWTSLDAGERATVPPGFRRLATFLRFNSTNFTIELATIPPTSYTFFNMHPGYDYLRTEQPAAFRVALAARNLPTAYYEIKVYYLTLGWGMYAHRGEHLIVTVSETKQRQQALSISSQTSDSALATAEALEKVRRETKT